MPTIRWGILGCGDVTEVKSGPGFQKAANSQLVAVMRRDAAKAADYAHRHNIPRWYDNADALINDNQVDAVYIATPPGAHELYALKTLAAGKPCYIEKPMTRNAPEARRIVDGFKAANLPLFVAYYRRAMPRFLKVKQLLNDDHLGKITSMKWFYASDQMAKPINPIPWRLVPEHSGGGLFLDLASHALDLLDYWAGPLEVTSATATSRLGLFNAEDYVALKFRAPNNLIGAVVTDFTDRTNRDEFVLTGEKATLRVSCFGNDPLRVKHHDGREESLDIPKPDHVQLPLIQTIVNDLLGSQKCPSTGRIRPPAPNK